MIIFLLEKEFHLATVGKIFFPTGWPGPNYNEGAVFRLYRTIADSLFFPPPLHRIAAADFTNSCEKKVMVVILAAGRRGRGSFFGSRNDWSGGT